MADNIARALAIQAKKGLDTETIKSTTTEWLETNGIKTGATEEQAAQIQSNTENIEKIQALSDSLDTLVISESEPIIDDKCLWIQSGKYESFDIPHINEISNNIPVLP